MLRGHAPDPVCKEVRSDHSSLVQSFRSEQQYGCGCENSSSNFLPVSQDQDHTLSSGTTRNHQITTEECTQKNGAIGLPEHSQ